MKAQLEILLEIPQRDCYLFNMLTRELKLPEILAKKSHFLFGPRGTGKSTLIKQQLLGQANEVIVISLLNSDYFLRLSSRPAELENIIKKNKHSMLVVIDEVQKLPILLDEVHRLIEEQGIKFLLTGSSARKLRRGGANLLGGRAWTANLFPLTSNEIPNFDLERFLLYGGLPAVYLSDYPVDELNSYIQNYLVEEISAEGFVRDLPLFSRFLHKAALSNAELLNFTEIGSDLGISPTTVREYYRIMEDTLVGFILEPLRSSKNRKEISTAKFYLFDTGVANALRSIKELPINTEYYGTLLEQFIAQELRAALSYQRVSLPFNFWRTHSQHEVDFVVGDVLAIEVKATQSSNRRMAQGLRQIAEHYSFKHRIVVSRDPIERLEEGVSFLPYDIFLERLWVGDYFS